MGYADCFGLIGAVRGPRQPAAHTDDFGGIRSGHAGGGSEAAEIERSAPTDGCEKKEPTMFAYKGSTAMITGCRAQNLEHQ